MEEIPSSTLTNQDVEIEPKENLTVVFLYTDYKNKQKEKTYLWRSNNKETWKPAVDYGKFLGIPEYQLDFPIEE